MLSKKWLLQAVAAVAVVSANSSVIAHVPTAQEQSQHQDQPKSDKTDALTVAADSAEEELEEEIEKDQDTKK